MVRRAFTLSLLLVPPRAAYGAVVLMVSSGAGFRTMRA